MIFKIVLAKNISKCLCDYQAFFNKVIGWFIQDYCGFVYTVSMFSCENNIMDEIHLYLGSRNAIRKSLIPQIKTSYQSTVDFALGNP